MKTSREPQSVSIWPAASLVVSNMVGTGVFVSLGFQISSFSQPDGRSLLTGSVFPIIMVWVIGGILALCGALCYAELATALPRSGGEYNFLSRIYHPVVGFCAGLCSATVGFAAPIAASALLFGDYFCSAFPGLRAFDLTPKMLAFVLVTITTLFHLRSLRFSGVFQSSVTAVTVLLLLTFVVCGFTRASSQPVTFLPHAADWNLPVLTAFFGSLIWVTYAYSGWNAASYIVGEVRDPARALPRALILGTLFVLCLYVAVNSVFLYTTPISHLAGQPEVGHLAGVSIFGPVGARISSVLICVGLVANVSAMMWIGSRVSAAIGATYPTLGSLAISNRRRVPYVALLYQYAIIFVLLFFNPKEIINYVESVLILWSLLAVLGVIVLRRREPNLLRPYRTWASPGPPLVFAAISICCLVQNCKMYPIESTVGSATVLIGIPVYFWARRSVSDEDLRSEALAPAVPKKFST